jgi:hypothetical protein
VLSGKVTLGGVPKGDIKVQVRNGGKGGSARFVNTRTQSDGTYSISLPAGPYSRVCAIAPGLPSSSCPSGATDFVDNLSITAGVTTMQDFAIP